MLLRSPKTVVVWLAVATVGVCFGGTPTGAALDDELAKSGAARAVAESLMTDETYEATISQFAQLAIPILQNPGSANGTLSALAKKDEKLFNEAMLATMREVVPKEFLVRAWEHYFASTLSYEDLRAAVAFIRSPSGARFWKVATDQAGYRKALDAEPQRVDIDPDAIFKRELKLRFPQDKVEF
jgi:hypothetical protein